MLSLDARLILLARILRSFGYGALGTVLALHLDRLQLAAFSTGAVLTSALMGSLMMNIAWSLAADRIGRRG